MAGPQGAPTSGAGQPLAVLPAQWMPLRLTELPVLAWSNPAFKGSVACYFYVQGPHPHSRDTVLSPLLPLLTKARRRQASEGLQAGATAFHGAEAVRPIDAPGLEMKGLYGHPMGALRSYASLRGPVAGTCPSQPPCSKKEVACDPDLQSPLLFVCYLSFRNGDLDHS